MSGKNSKNKRKMSINKNVNNDSPFTFSELISVAGTAKGTPQEMFSVKFNYFIQDRDIFATITNNQVMLFECIDKDPATRSGFKLLRAYAADENDEECFYCLAWSYDVNRSNEPILVFGGKNHIIRIAYINQHKNLYSYENKKLVLKAHTGAINDLKFSPEQPHVLISASADLSIRMWNVDTEHLIAIFSGHRDQVIAVDFANTGNAFISAGMDHNLEVWVFPQELKDKIDESQKSQSQFKPMIITEASLKTRDIHRQYIDGVCWFGDSFLSKSVENEIVWWKFVDLVGKNGVVEKKAKKMKSFEVENCEIWYVRFEINVQKDLMAVGDTAGNINMWNLRSGPISDIKRMIIPAPNNLQLPIRMISFSLDGKIMIACSDGGKLLRFDKAQ